MFIWGLLAGLTHGFRQRRPWEGWWGAFTRACNVVALFYVAVFAVLAGVALYEHFIGHPRAEARSQRIAECRQAGEIPVPVTYPGGPLTYIPDEVTIRCENEAR